MIATDWEKELRELANGESWEDELRNLAEPKTIYAQPIPEELELPGPEFRTTPEDIRDIEKRAKDVLDLAQKHELSIGTVEDNYDEIGKQISEFDPNLFDGLGILDELEAAKKERPGLLKRIGMSFLRKTIIEPLIAVETKSRAISGMGILLETTTLAKEFREETGRDPTGEEYNELAKLGKAIYVNSVYRKYSFLNIAPPKTLAEKAAEVGTGLASFLTQLAVAKKVLGPGGTGRDVMAWEMVSMAEGGPVGKGAVMRLAFAGINKVPAKTFVGKTLKTTAVGTTLASATAISGGSKEDVAVAFLIPFALKAIRATSAEAAKLTRGALEKRTIKQMRTFVGDRGYDLSKVPDDALREIINVAKKGNWWAKQYKKGKINEATLDKRLTQLQDRIKPIIVAIAKQQPEKDVMAKYQRRIADRIERGGPTTAVDIRAMVAQGQAELDQVLSGKAPLAAPIEIPKVPPEVVEKPPEPPIEPITPERRAVEAKKARAPIEQLGGLPIEPPGLTKAEVVHLGKREQVALRAGQRLGQKIGYKKGYQEAALIGRRKLNVLRMDVAISKKSKEDLRGVIQWFVPKEEQYRFMTRLGRVKDAKGVQKITGEIEHFIEQYEHRSAVRHFKTFVSGIKSKYRSGEVAFGQLPDNLRDKVMSVIDAYDTVRLSEMKAEDLIAHKEHIQKVSGSIADAFSNWENLDEQGLDILQLPNYRIRELQRLEKIPVADLTIDEIEFIQNELESLLATNERKGQIKARIRAERLHTHVTGAANEIHPRGETTAGEIKQPGYARRFAGIEQAQIRTLAGFATAQENEHTMHLLVDQLYEANRKRAANYKDFILYTREQRVKRGITDADFNKLDEPVTVILGGKEITIKQGSLLSLWMDTEAEGNLRRLLTARGHNLRSDKNKPIRVGKVTLQEIQDAIAKLSDKTKAVGEMAFDVNFQKQAPALNETWMELYNYPIAKQERHWPFPRELERLVEGPRAEISLSMEMQGRYLPRTGGNARHTVIPFTRQFMKGLQADAATAAMTGSMQQVKALLANKKWRSRMRDSGQQPVMDAITTMLRRSQGLISDQSVADLIAAKFLGRAGKSLLSARPSGMLIQTASISAGYETIEPKYFINLAVPTPSAIKELKELSPTLWIRWEAKQFDYALGAASAQSGFKTLIMGKPPITDRLVKHYTWGDQIAIYYGWTAAQNKIAAETNFARGTDEFTNASLDLLHRWLESQPQWDILNRTLLTSHPSPWLRGSMMFMSARNAQYNVMLRAYDDYAKGRIGIGEFSTRIGGVVQANITVSLARRLFRLGVKAAVLSVLFGLSDEDDKELVKEIAKEQVVKDIKKVPLESVLNMFGLVAFGQIASTIGYEAARQIEGKTFPKKLSEARTGNIIADFTMDFTQFGITSAKLAKEIWTGEVYVDRKRMGEAKWKDTAVDLANVAAEIIALITGTPYSGPRSDIVWPTKTVLRGMSEDEYEKMRAELNKLRKKALQELIKELVKKGELPIKK